MRQAAMPITYVPIWRSDDFVAKAIIEPKFVLVFYGVKFYDVTESMVMNALIRRKLRLRDYDWELYETIDADQSYHRRVTREYIRQGITI